MTALLPTSIDIDNWRFFLSFLGLVVAGLGAFAWICLEVARSIGESK